MRLTSLVPAILLAACSASPAVPTPTHDAAVDATTGTDAPVTDATVSDATVDATTGTDATVTDAGADVPRTNVDGGPAVAAYEACAGPGAACGSGTTCVQSLAYILGPGPRYVCSKACSVASDCPGYAADGGVDCLRTPRGGPQCVVHCNAGDVDCMPYNLNCYAASVPGNAAMVEFCVP